MYNCKRYANICNDETEDYTYYWFFTSSTSVCIAVNGFFFFLQGGSQLGPQDPCPLVHCPIPLIEIHRGLFRSPASLPRATIPLSLTSFICSGSILAKPKVCLTFYNTGYSRRMCTDVFFSALHLHEGVFALLILCSMYCRLISPVRSPTNIQQCFLSSFLMNWTYLSVGLSRQSTGPILFKCFPFCLFPFFNPVPYFGLKSA